MTRRRTLAVAAVALALAGCGPSAPDYQSIWSTTSSAPATTTTSAAPAQPFSEYLEDLGVVGRPVAADKLTDLIVSIPAPEGWQPYVNDALAPGTRTITKGNGYPSAMLVVFELTGKFAAGRSIHGKNEREGTGMGWRDHKSTRQH